MQKVDINIKINAPVAKVWDYIQDHRGYRNFPFVHEAVLLEKGKENQNGIGALRRISGLGLSFTERITGFNPPFRLDYSVVECTIPLIHHYGYVTLEENSGVTFVKWQTGFDVDIPVIGDAVAFAGKQLASFMFEQFLWYIKKKTERA